MNQEEPKKPGCFGGCLGVLFWLGLTFSAGWYACNLEYNNWDFKAAEIEGCARVAKHGRNLWGKVTGSLPFGGGTGQTTPVQKKTSAGAEAQNTVNWIGLGEEAYRNAARLLKSAEKTVGAEQTRLLRMAQKELQTAHDNYVKAGKMDTGNQELVRKISEIGKMLEQFNKKR